MQPTRQRAMPTVTLQVPEQLYARIRERAERSRRSVEAELVDVLTAAVPDGDDLAFDLFEAITALDQLGDAELREAARQKLPGEVSEELQSPQGKQSHGN